MTPQPRMPLPFDAEPSIADPRDASPRVQHDASMPGARDVSRTAIRDTSAIAQPSPLEAATATEAPSWPEQFRCQWCKERIPVGHRSDSRFCKKACRQAAHRFGKDAPRRAATAQPMTFAYADPPYPDKARRYYGDHPDFDGEVDHQLLIERLVREYPDGWALSTSAFALPWVLCLCPDGVRVAAWVRGERKVPSRRPRPAWEPVIYFGGRDCVTPPQQARPDALVHGVSPRITDPERVTGAKAAAFAYWMFDLLGALPGDALDDLYPGSGGIARAWSVYVSRSPGLALAGLDVDDEGTAS